VTVPKHPEIERIKKELKANGALASWMSGSGPTVVGMFGTEKACNMAFEKLNRKEWRVIKTKNC
jgi:4-diphosphocytidyl-2-C-methyl-D-erythritol kinase